jgi:hypothetical protein
MGKIVSSCGLLCNECGAFVATKDNDDAKRKEVARLWSKQYNTNLKLEDINCTGCLSDRQPIFGHCNVCEIRKCGKAKGIKNCAYCGGYTCDKLAQFFRIVPDARKRLDKIKSGL